MIETVAARREPVESGCSPQLAEEVQHLGGNVFRDGALVNGSKRVSHLARSLARRAPARPSDCLGTVDFIRSATAFTLVVVVEAQRSPRPMAKTYAAVPSRIKAPVARPLFRKCRGQTIGSRGLGNKKLGGLFHLRERPFDWTIGPFAAAIGRRVRLA